MLLPRRYSKHHKLPGKLHMRLLIVIAAASFICCGKQKRISVTKLKTHRHDLVLVTSFWAAGPDADSKSRLKANSRRREIENAVALNVANSMIREVRIILDGFHQFYNCTTLQKRIRGKILDVCPSSRTRLVCIERNGSQPSYFEMFNYTTDPALSGSIIILANADMVFDQTVLRLHDLNVHTAATISTRGFGDGCEPCESIQHQLKLLGMQPLRMRSADRCYKQRPRSSWDAYVFHFNALKFDPHGFHDDRSNEKFTMNTNGAENVALYYLKHASPNITFYQICDHVNMWHIHAAPKTHSSEIWVYGPRAIAAECASIEDCLGIRGL